MTGISGLYHGTRGSLEGQVEWLHEENDRLRNENEKLRNEIDCMREEFQHREKAAHDELIAAIRMHEKNEAQMLGMIDALKYAIRCNGISGAEVE